MDRKTNISDKIFVTGTGIISAIGLGMEETLVNLTYGKSGIGEINFLKTKLSEKLIAGEVPYSNNELTELAGIKNTSGISRAALLGLIAAKEATKKSDFTNPEIRTGFISGTTAEAMTSIESYFPDFLKNDKHNEYIESQDWGHSTEIIANELGIKGFFTTINTACSSAANAIMLGARMIKNNKLDRVLVGGTDALSKVMLNGFHALMIVDPEPCKPFDDKRNGMNIGEGAAFLVLESEKLAKASNSICELSGYGNSNDAYHLTALSSDGTGAALAMETALKKANLKPTQIDYLNAHGTGTLNNDLSEARAIETIFKGQPPLISSTKPFTGHTLGSSGALEAVFSILSIQNDLAFTNLNFEQPMNEVELEPIKTLVKNTDIKHVMSNSLGFGGNNTSLIFSRY